MITYSGDAAAAVGVADDEFAFPSYFLSKNLEGDYKTLSGGCY